jgi:motility quorum-sensing regulator/GCU-specific mRNA interferase toxin
LPICRLIETESGLTKHHNGVILSVVDKRKPTYDLEAFKAACGKVETLHVTGAALRGAAALGFGRADIVATVQMMHRQHFYKSMTSYADHRIWQDLYHVPSEARLLYIKFTADAVTEFVLLSFKEKDDD